MLVMIVSWSVTNMHTMLLQVASSQLLTQGEQFVETHGQTSDAVVDGDHRVETSGTQEDAHTARTGRNRRRRPQRLRRVQNDAVITCIKVLLSPLLPQCFWSLFISSHYSYSNPQTSRSVTLTAVTDYAACFQAQLAVVGATTSSAAIVQCEPYMYCWSKDFLAVC